ncbi:SpoIIE family protein phosphatase [Streptomyces sp. Ru72]|uniref:SpoIIE family protein phosphatase n=1 Tax=Streptomyces sp. Ru72 TaxID=2080747 RepID=UPI0015E41082|nr:SpoIIE family protein phosphatase [Streptomyces sp. Ru72]
MASGAVLARITGDGRIVEWSGRAEALLGRSRSEAEGRTITALLSRTPSIAEALDRVSVRPVLSGTELTWEVREERGAGDARRDHALLRTLFTHSPVALYVLDHDLRVLCSRDERREAVAPDAAPGAPDFPTALGLEDPERERAVARQVLDTGEPALQRLVRAVPAGGTGRPVSQSLSYVRLEGLDGEVLGLVASALDVTDRERALNRLRLLEKVRASVGTQLEVASVCRELADAVVPAFTGIAVVEVIDDVIRGDEPPLAPVDSEVPLRRTAFRGLVSAHAVGDVRRLPEGTPYSRVLHDLRPRLVTVTEDSRWLAADPARANAITLSDAHSLIVAPLTVRGQALGVVSFYRHRDEGPFDEDDIALASDVCAHAALCIDNARRFTYERTIAATVKRRLLPQRPSIPRTLDVASMHIPGPGGGGAWFDVIELAGGRTLLVHGDVTGRGVGTATTMGQLRTVIHALAALDLEPDELIARLSDTAVQLAAERTRLPAGDPLHREPLTASCLIAVYDAVDHTCTMARAGLAEPYLVMPGGDGADVSAPGGPVLAGADRSPFPVTAFSMPSGSILAVGNEDLLQTVDGLRDLLREGRDLPLDDLADALAYELRDRHETEKLILLARARGLPGERVLTVPLAEDLSAVPAARAAARRRLREWSVDGDDAFTTELIVSELVANALRYGAPPYRLRLILDERLTSEVRDAGMSAPHLKHARQMDESGRGLFIVAGVADGWGVRLHDHGKTVWARQTLSETGHAQPASPPPT